MMPFLTIEFLNDLDNHDLQISEISDIDLFIALSQIYLMVFNEDYSKGYTFQYQIKDLEAPAERTNIIKRIKLAIAELGFKESPIEESDLLFTSKEGSYFTKIQN